MVDVDDEAAMRAPEEIGIEQIEQVFEGSALGVALDGWSDNADVPLFDGGKAYLRLIDEQHAALHLDDELAGHGAGWSGLVSTEQFEQHGHVRLFGAAAGVYFNQAGAGAFDSLKDASLIERLEQIIDRVDIEGADRVLIKGRGEDDLGHALDKLMINEVPKESESVETGHLDIEKENVGLMDGDEFDGLNAVGGFGENLHISGGIEEKTQLFARQGFVVNDERAKRGRKQCGVLGGVLSRKRRGGCHGN
uniref:Uncharacterized protein n=1 Tax=mine drainage metagenome TaxID=410659 RepID=E6Q049_9ZZZZ